jgi:hypothetical protein
MMKTQITDDIKKGFLESHFSYEVRMIMEDIRMINPNTGQVPNAVLVDFLVHIRILYEFFYKFEKGNKAHAGDYIESWKDKKSPPEIEKWNMQINNFLSHLSYERVNKKYNPYPVFMFYGYFGNLVINFLSELSDKYKTPSLKKLLEDLRQEIKII